MQLLRDTSFMRILSPLLLMGVLLAVGCEGPKDRAATNSEAQRRAQPVSLIQLIASPDRFDGRLVRVQGFGVIQYEAMGVFHSAEDADYGNTKDGIWLELDTEQVGRYRHASGREIIVEGIFSEGMKGHLSAWSGALTKVRRLEVLSPANAQSTTGPSPD